MSEGYRTEEEQVEALKKWWAENGKSTLISIVVAIAAVFGWEGYQKQHQAAIEQASAIYQNMLTAANGSNGRPTPEQLATAKHLADTLKQDFPDSTYAQFAAMYKARFAVDGKDLATAEQELHWVLDNASMAEMQIQARLRLARVLYAQDKYEEALQQLQGDTEAYAASYAEVKGDVFKAQGKNEQALAAYEEAVELNSKAEKPVNNGLLKIKLEQLKSTMGIAATEDA